MRVAATVKSAGQYVLGKFGVYVSHQPIVGGKSRYSAPLRPTRRSTGLATEAPITFMTAISIEVSHSTSMRPARRTTGSRRSIVLRAKLRINTN